MLHVIDHNRGANGDVLRAMFEARKQVFVDLLKWDVPVIGGTFEIDEFDDGHAAYLVLTDASGAHLASARLLKTVRPHILGTLFSALCEGAVPRGHDTREITRFCLDRRLKAHARRAARNRLVSGLAAYALGEGVRRYTAVAEQAWLKQIEAFGWTCRALGSVQRHAAADIAALLINIDADTPARLAATGIWNAPDHPPLERAA